MLDLATIKARAVVRLAAATAPGARAAAAAKPANPTIRALVAEAPGPIGQLATLAKLASNNATSRLAEQGRRPDPDRWCWPHSDAMNTVELATMTARLRKFERRGFAYAQA